MNVSSISRFRKERYLLSLSEDRFRDEVIRPLFLRQGLRDGRDCCGPNEKGKDAVFVNVDKLGMEDYYVIQTKRGKVNLSGRPTENAISAITQLRTALETPIFITARKSKVLASKAFLCISGKITENARVHIVSEVADARVVFFDSDDLIPKIDEVIPEFWLGIDIELFPYLRAVKKSVDDPKEDQSISDILPKGSVDDAASNGMFIELRVNRHFMRPTKRRGQVYMEAKFEDIPVSGLISRKERLILITGEAGSGKSTSLKRIAYVLADRGLADDKSPRIPVLLRATEIVLKPDLELLDACSAAAMSFTGKSTPAFSSNDLEAGRLVVLIDGLDEVSTDLDRENILNRIIRFHKLFPKGQIIVASRDYSFIARISIFNEFEKFRLHPINFRQAEKLLKRFEKRRSLSPERSKEILRRLQEVHGMELNPLLVTVFAATTDYSRRDIPANITELFKKYTEMMLGRWDADKGLAQQYHAPLKDFLLKVVAFEMHRRKVTNIPLKEFQDMIGLELRKRGYEAEVGQLTEEILYRSGLFRILGDNVEYRHHLLQEFFAGRGIPDKSYLLSVISDEWWRRGIVFFFGERPGESETFQTLISELNLRPILDRFNAALSIGLGLQACYLMNTDDKNNILPWVITTVSDAKDPFLSLIDNTGKYPLSRFLGYYLVGREAIACNILKDAVADIEKRILVEGLNRGDNEIRKFWLLAGLIECGDLSWVAKQVKNFYPEDPRLLLAIHLGCFLLQNHRIAEAEERKLAGEVSRELANRVAHLRNILLSEFKSELIELQNGQIKALECQSEG